MSEVQQAYNHVGFYDLFILYSLHAQNNICFSRLIIHCSTAERLLQ